MPNETEARLSLRSFALSGRRVGAALIDCAAFAASAAGISTAGLAATKPRGWDALAYIIWFSLLGFVLVVMLQAWSLWKRSGTLGQRVARIIVLRKGVVAKPAVRLVHWLLVFALPIGTMVIGTFVFENLDVAPACAAAVCTLNYALLIFTGRSFNDFVLGARVERSRPTSVMQLD